MYRTLLKLLIFEVVEKIARTELLLQELAADSEAISPALVQSLQQKLDVLKTHVLEERVYINQLFADKTTPERNALEKLNQIVYGPYQTLSRLSQFLNSYLQGNVLPETYVFLQDALSEKFSRQQQQQTVIFQNEGDVSQEAPFLLDNVLIESVSILNKNNPLGWVGLVQRFVEDLYQQSSVAETLAFSKKGKTLDEKLLKPLATHLMALRLIGPAFYSASVIQALLNQDAFFLYTLEPALFYGINHLNFSDKNLLILHEATEKSREVLFPADKGSVKSIDTETLAVVLRQVEKLIPEKAAFTETQFHRSAQLQERLAQGILLSSSRLHRLEDVHEALTLKVSEPQDPRADVPIYDILNMVAEVPNTPLEIVNAGWSHKLERASVWLYTAFNGTEEDGFERLLSLLNNQDQLLLKSIETSEIHRVLRCGV